MVWRGVQVRIAAVGAAALLLASCARRPAPVSPVRASDAGEVVLPPGYDPDRAYPVVEILPPTGNTAEALLQLYLSDVGLGHLYDQPPPRQLEALWPHLVPASGSRRAFILIIARGRGAASDYATADAWARTIARYERQVLADLRAVAAQRRVDTKRMVVAGFSLGGDLAWALTLRNPGLLHGAVVMASRATYRPTPEQARQAAARGLRFYLAMGEQDQAIRRRLARDAAAVLDRWGVKHRFRLVPGMHHEPAPPDVFAEALEFVLAS